MTQQGPTLSGPMTKADPHDMKEKRASLYSDKADDTTRNACADHFIQAERFGEALEFLEMTKDAPRLDQVQSAALQRGDTFLLSRIEKIRDAPLDPSVWREVAATAQKNLKFLDAYRALTEAGDEEEAEALRSEHMPDYEPWKPEGK